MAFVLENAKRRRLVGNQRAPALRVLPLATLTALADEARSEVVAVVAVNPPGKKKNLMGSGMREDEARYMRDGWLSPGPPPPAPIQS